MPTNQDSNLNTCTEQITEENYIPYEVYIKSHLQSNGYEFDDFKNLSNVDFKEKYSVDRNIVNKKAIETYKTDYELHYLYAKKIYEEKNKDKIAQMNRQKEIKQEYLNTREDGMIKMIQTQTNYDYDTAKKLLLEKNHNYLQVIREYLSGDGENKSISSNSDTKKESFNQEIYCQIRDFMDDVNRQYEKRKIQKAEYEKKIQQIQQQRQMYQDISENTVIENKIIKNPETI